MTTVKDKEERKLHKCKIALMRNSKFALWSGIMMVGTTSISDGVPTAYTDGRDEVYGRDFIKRLPERQLNNVTAIFLITSISVGCRYTITYRSSTNSLH